MPGGLSNEQVSRLRTAKTEDFRRLAPFRKNRREAIELYKGPFYSSDGREMRTPLNLLALAVTVFKTQFASRPPQVDMTTKYLHLVDQVEDFQEVVNEVLRDYVKLGDSMKELTPNALFSVGIIKVGRWKMGLDGIYADCVSLDDFVCDMSAKRLSDCAYYATRHRVQLDHAKRNPRFRKDVRKKLKPMPLRMVTEDGGKTTHSISTGQSTKTEELHEYTEYWEYFLPNEQRTVIIAECDETLAPLLDEEWEGPPRGPLHFLGFHLVPDNPLPLPPVANWRDLHEEANRILSDIIIRAKRLKEIVGYSGASEDGETLNQAKDGNWVRVDGPNSTKVIRTGGIDPPILALFLELRQLFSYGVGGLDSLGGFGPVSDTVGQEKIVRNSANAQIADMQNSVYDFVQGIVEDIAWYVWNDPFAEMLIEVPIPGLPGETDVSLFSPGVDRGDFSRMKIKIRPNSMQDLSPEKILATIDSYLDRVLSNPQVFLSQGVTIDFHEYTKLYAEHTGVSELLRVVRFMDSDESAGVEEPNRPAVTRRENVRINRSAPTMNAMESAIMQRAMGKPAQPSEDRAMFG